MIVFLRIYSGPLLVSVPILVPVAAGRRGHAVSLHAAVWGRVRDTRPRVLGYEKTQSSRNCNTPAVFAEDMTVDYKHRRGETPNLIL